MRGPTAERERQRFNDYSIYEDDCICARETTREREGVHSSDGDGQDRPARIIDSPDLASFLRASDGHPQSPWAVSQNGDAPPEHEFVCPPPDPDYPQQEEARIDRAKQKTHRERRDKQPPVWRGQDPYLLGRWDRCKIQTLEQAYNLVAFLDIGQEQVYELFTITVQNMGNFPLQFRTEGEAHLMRHQQELEKRWWICTTSAPRPPRYVRHPQVNGRAPWHMDAATSGGSRYRISDDTASVQDNTPAEMQNGLASNLRPYGTNARPAFGGTYSLRPAGPSTAASRTPLPTTAPTTAAAPSSDRRPVAYTDATSAQGYLGRSLPNPSDVAPVSAENEFPALDLTPNTRWSAGELNNRYWRTPPSRWGLGLHSVLLRITLNAGDTPWCDDVLSFHTMIALSPPGCYPVCSTVPPVLRCGSSPFLDHGTVRASRTPWRIRGSLITDAALPVYHGRHHHLPRRCLVRPTRHRARQLRRLRHRKLLSLQAEHGGRHREPREYLLAR
ncbi:hypothetical protein B0H17DRAFT_303600 [Mycena rosella]|uniref:Uncharacterized protein n=1 Tax=Mycena rosella TaxID=1033263 RepID=A0AAD7CU71_MYCRO|nr:hypothetical protein B0H17DRAFT_303600 [Mycena rosella]